MNYITELRIYKDPENIFQLFEAETNRIIKDRASWNLKKKKDHLLIEIKAKDSTALKSILNSMTKILTVYEKMEIIK